MSTFAYKISRQYEEQINFKPPAYSECQLVFHSVTELKDGGDISKVFIVELNKIHIQIVTNISYICIMNVYRECLQKVHTTTMRTEQRQKLCFS